MTSAETAKPRSTQNTPKQILSGRGTRLSQLPDKPKVPNDSIATYPGTAINTAPSQNLRLPYVTGNEDNQKPRPRQKAITNNVITPHDLLLDGPDKADSFIVIHNAAICGRSVGAKRRNGGPVSVANEARWLC